MDTRYTRPFSWATLASALALGSLSAPALAQNATPTVATCNVKGDVTLTVAGISTNLPLPCVNRTEQTAPGTDTSAVVGTTTLGVPAVSNVASVSAPFGESAWTESAGTTVLTGDAGASDVSLVQGGVTTTDVAGSLTCITPTANIPNPADCEVEMTIGTLSIGGQNIPIPSEPIPVNTTIPISNLPVTTNVAGIGLVTIPLSGTLTLNKFTVTGEGTPDVTIEHAPISLDVSGSYKLLGIPLVTLTVKLDDYESIACGPKWCP